MIPKLPIIECKLGRERCYGRFIPDRHILIDPRQSPRCYMNTLIHEVLHSDIPELSERHVIHLAHVLTSRLWEMNYRRVMQ